MLSEETRNRIDDLLKGGERCVIADCVYKYGEFRDFAVSFSDSRERDFDIPYADISGHEDDELIDLLTIRKSQEYQDLVRPIITDLYDYLESKGFDMKDKQAEIDGFCELTKPVLLVSLPKKK